LVDKVIGKQEMWSKYRKKEFRKKNKMIGIESKCVRIE
jgi:hypothetical protein